MPLYRKGDFVLIKKPIKDEKIFYFYYYFSDDNIHCHRSGRFSTGVKFDPLKPQKSETEAKKRARIIIADKEVKRIQAKVNIPKFKDYTENWFIWDKCDFLKEEFKRGKTPSRTWTDTKRGVVVNQLQPTFGKKYLDEIITDDIEKWMFKLAEDVIDPKTGEVKKSRLSGRTINAYYGVMSIIMGEACRKGIIKDDPTKNVLRMGENRAERKILTIPEFRKLFAAEDVIDTIWNKQLIAYTAAQTAATTGMRMGEIQALKIENIDFKEKNIYVCHSWDRNYGLKGTKTNTDRWVPINDDLIKALLKCKGEREFGFLFSLSDGKQPLDHKAISKWFYRALVNIEIKENDRKDRGLTFHSLRHFANTHFLNETDQRAAMAIIGHDSEAMSELYDHPEKEFLDTGRLAQDRLYR